MKSPRHLRPGPNGEFRHRLRRRIRDSVSRYGGLSLISGTSEEYDFGDRRGLS